jgi:hypothetical protein
MLSAIDYGIQNDPATTAAVKRVKAHLTLGIAEQRRLVDYCARNIPRDRYVPPKQMRFAQKGGQTAWDTKLVIQYIKGGKREELAVHDHAMGQLCDMAGLDRRYWHKLDVPSDDSWRRGLLAHNLNTIFDLQPFVNRLKKPASFLHRIVGNEVRAVLTQSYNRHLVSNAVLQPFLAACEEVGLQPAKAIVTDMRVHLQTYLPFAFQPVPGEFVALGTCWGNSDFGQGKLKINHNILRLNGGGGNLLTDDTFSRVHLRSVVEDSDVVMDDAVAVKELEAIAAATRSAVVNAMQPDQVQRLLDAIREAAEEQVPWDKLKAQLAKALTKADVVSLEDMLTSHIEELPPPGVGTDGQPLPSRWWAAAALAQLAEKTADPGRSMEIKQVAGQYLL